MRRKEMKQGEVAQHREENDHGGNPDQEYRISHQTRFEAEKHDQEQKRHQQCVHPETADEIAVQQRMDGTGAAASGTVEPGKAVKRTPGNQTDTVERVEQNPGGKEKRDHHRRNEQPSGHGQNAQPAGRGFAFECRSARQSGHIKLSSP